MAQAAASLAQVSTWTPSESRIPRASLKTSIMCETGAPW